jgi:hypothetical protein
VSSHSIIIIIIVIIPMNFLLVGSKEKCDAAVDKFNFLVFSRAVGQSTASRAG